MVNFGLLTAEIRWRVLGTPANFNRFPVLAALLHGTLVVGVSQAASRPKFTILWGQLEDILLLNEFFSIVDTCLSCEDIARQICTTVPRWGFLATFLHPRFSASRVQHVSDLHPKFALTLLHHVWKYSRHPISDR